MRRGLQPQIRLFQIFDPIILANRLLDPRDGAEELSNQPGVPVDGLVRWQRALMSSDIVTVLPLLAQSPASQGQLAS